MSENEKALLRLTQELVRCESITPDDAGCLDIITRELADLSFDINNFSSNDVSNLWATHGSESPIFVFAGHTDVVPPGPINDWQYPPFNPTLENGYLYGRGTADMKGSLAAMIIAAKTYLANNPNHKGTLAFLLTSDEEGPAIDGTRHVIEELKAMGTVLDYCLVGEPSSNNQLGDTVRIGRRGSLNAKITIIGNQGHVAYPHLAKNPIHEFAPALARLTNLEIDKGNKHFPPTSLQISNISAGTGAQNVIPGSLSVDLNIRFNTEQSERSIKTLITSVLEETGQDFEIKWQLSGNPFITKQGKLRTAVKLAIKTITGLTPEESTSGGTSDGRFIAPTGCEVVELGPKNRTIHKVNEHIAVSELMPLSEIYCHLLGEILGSPDG